MAVLAEGIETCDQLERLRREGCDQGQGFLLAKPMPAVATERFLAEIDQTHTARSFRTVQLALEAGVAA